MLRGEDVRDGDEAKVRGKHAVGGDKMEPLVDGDERDDEVIGGGEKRVGEGEHGVDMATIEELDDCYVEERSGGGVHLGAGQTRARMHTHREKASVIFWSIEI